MPEVLLPALPFPRGASISCREASDGVGVSTVGEVFLALLAFLEAFFHVFHEEVEFVKVDVGKYRCAD